MCHDNNSAGEKKNQVVVASDGQVSMGNTVIKKLQIKLERLRKEM